MLSKQLLLPVIIIKLLIILRGANTVFQLKQQPPYHLIRISGARKGKSEVNIVFQTECKCKIRLISTNSFLDHFFVSVLVEPDKIAKCFSLIFRDNIRQPKGPNDLNLLS